MSDERAERLREAVAKLLPEMYEDDGPQNLPHWFCADQVLRTIVTELGITREMTTLIRTETPCLRDGAPEPCSDCALAGDLLHALTALLDAAGVP